MSAPDWADEAARTLLDVDATSGDIGILVLAAPGVEAREIVSGPWTVITEDCDALCVAIAAALRAEREACAALLDARAEALRARLTADGDGYSSEDASELTGVQRLAVQMRGRR